MPARAASVCQPSSLAKAYRLGRPSPFVSCFTDWKRTRAGREDGAFINTQAWMPALQSEGNSFTHRYRGIAVRQKYLLPEKGITGGMLLQLILGDFRPHSL